MIYHYHFFIIRIIAFLGIMIYHYHFFIIPELCQLTILLIFENERGLEFLIDNDLSLSFLCKVGRYVNLRYIP